MNRSPHAVQIAGLKKIHPLRGGAYFMEQGLGKTGTAYMDFLEHVAERNVTRLVVICPNSFKGGWVDEAAEWGFDIDPYIYEAGDDHGFNQFLKKKFAKPPVMIINFESVRIVKKRNGKSVTYLDSKGMAAVRRFIEGRNCMLVVDESIQVSTHDALQTLGVIHLSKEFPYSRVLSGKPIKQGPHDLWSQMRIIKELEGRNYYAFRNAFCRMGGFKMKQVIGAQNEDILAELIEHAIFRATKEEWTDLPPKIFMTREYSLSPEMKAIYSDMENDFITWISDDVNVTVDAAITKYIKLAQIQAGFIFDENKKFHELVAPSKNPRLSLLKDVLDTVPGKAIIVYNHKPVRTMLDTELSAMRPVFIHGGMTEDEIRENKRIFNEDRSCRVICITKAAKYGHTLLGNQSDPEHACADMIFYENTYALDDRSQLEDRSHRHGQKQDTMRYWDLVGTSLDKNAIRALQRKESVFQAVMKALKDRQ